MGGGYRKEHSMDQCLSRLKLSENLERHWSIQISGEIHMDQSLVHTFFLEKFVWTNGPESSSKVSPYTGIGPGTALPRIRTRLADKRLMGYSGIWILVDSEEPDPAGRGPRERPPTELWPLGMYD